MANPEWTDPIDWESAPQKRLKLEIFRGSVGLAAYLDGTRIAGPGHNGSMTLQHSFSLTESDVRALQGVLCQHVAA